MRIRRVSHRSLRIASFGSDLIGYPFALSVFYDPVLFLNDVYYIHFDYYFVRLGPTLHDTTLLEITLRNSKTGLSPSLSAVNNEESFTGTPPLTPGPMQWATDTDNSEMVGRLGFLQDEIAVAVASDAFQTNLRKFSLAFDGENRVNYNMIQKISKESTRHCEERPECLEDLHMLLVGAYTMIEHRRNMFLSRSKPHFTPGGITGSGILNKRGKGNSSRTKSASERFSGKRQRMVSSQAGFLKRKKVAKTLQFTSSIVQPQNPRSGRPGLRNLGNTCFLAASLQGTTSKTQQIPKATFSVDLIPPS